MIMPTTAERTGGLCMPCFDNPDRLEPSRIAKEHVRKHPPRCLTSFKVEPADVPDSEDITVVFRISCQCGQSRFQALGHYWQHPDTKEVVFLSPLTLKCDSCGKAALLFDIREHGYDGEQGECWSARGEGEPEPFKCDECGPATFEIYTKFNYPDDLFDEDEDLDFAHGREQDFFDWFSTHGRCSGCSELLEVIDYECA